VLEVRAVTPRGSKEKSGRVIRVSLTDGKILDPNAELEGDKLPVRPYRGPDHLPDQEPATREGYIPSLDPVREEGKLTVQAPPPPAKLTLVKSGFTKLDSPAWVQAANCLTIADLEPEPGKLFRLDGDKMSDLRAERGRAKGGPDGLWYGVIGGKLVSWNLSDDPKVLLAKAPGDKELSLNDITVSSNGFIYFTTLKDPDKGRLTAVNLKSGVATVCFDGDEHPELSNPNGIAASPDGKALFVVISNYKDRKRAGIYRFSIREDGTLDVAAGKTAKWASPTGPDGIAFGPDGNLYATDGNLVRAYGPGGKEIGKVQIPKDSGTNITFGGPDGRTMYVTTSKALYAGTVKEDR